MKIHLTLNTSDDKEISVALPVADICDYGHEVCFPELTKTETALIIDAITVEGSELNAVALVNYAHGDRGPWNEDYIAVQFFNVMPSVDELMSVLAALQTTADNRGI